MVSASVAREVFRRYGIRNPRPRSYEVDYLIPPALGGTGDPRNLWPQPYSAGVWNARVKDALEDRLRTLVCEGKLDLATAQRDLAQRLDRGVQEVFPHRHSAAGSRRLRKRSPLGVAAAVAEAGLAVTIEAHVSQSAGPNAQTAYSRRQESDRRRIGKGRRGQNHGLRQPGGGAGGVGPQDRPDGCRRLRSQRAAHDGDQPDADGASAIASSRWNSTASSSCRWAF